MISITLFCCCEIVFTHMNTWIVGKHLTKPLPVNKNVYSHLNMEHITDADYTLEERVFIDFQMKSLGEYHGFYVQSDILLFSDVFESFQSMSQKYELDPDRFPTAPV